MGWGGWWSRRSRGKGRAASDFNQWRHVRPIARAVVGAIAGGMLAAVAAPRTAMADDAAPPETIWRSQRVLPLPPGLDRVPVFNSNSPELVLESGILLSSFPPTGLGAGDRDGPMVAFGPSDAHLDVGFRDRVDLFAHHVAKAADASDRRTLFLGVLAGNPGSEPARIDILRGASYLSQPDAPFVAMPPWQLNPLGALFAGPGDRAVATVLRGQRVALPPTVTVPPGGYALVLAAPIPVRELEPPLNGRSTLLQLRSDRPVYLASLARFGLGNDGDRPPALANWQELLAAGQLAGPRDRAPTPPDAPGTMIYGRVAGISQGSRWQAWLTDGPGRDRLSIPAPGEFVSWGLSTLAGGRLGTDQVQTAPLLRRYGDTAYAAHGNYALTYDLTLPLHNPSDRDRTVELRIETPIKFDRVDPPLGDRLNSGLRFFKMPTGRPFFRGTVRIRYTDRRGLPQTRYVHLVQSRGQSSPPLVTLDLPPRARALVRVEFIYPPDATPPQVLTLSTQPPDA